MGAVRELNQLAQHRALFYRIKMIARNSTHYRLEPAVAEYFGCEQVVKHNEVDLSIFGAKILFLTSCDDSLVETDMFKT